MNHTNFKYFHACMTMQWNKNIVISKHEKKKCFLPLLLSEKGIRDDENFPAHAYCMNKYLGEWIVLHKSIYNQNHFCEKFNIKLNSISMRISMQCGRYLVSLFTSAFCARLHRIVLSHWPCNLIDETTTVL